MTSIEINREILSTYRGRLMRRTGRTFKLVICLGPNASRAKLLVCVWADNGRTWSQPQAVDPATVEGIDLDLPPLPKRYLATITRAATNIKVAGGYVRHGAGAEKVGEPWLTKGDAARTAPAGVTKLAPVNYSAANKQQVRELNKVLGDATGRK